MQKVMTVMKLRDFSVSDLMTKHAVAVRSGEMLSVAAKLMWDNDCGIIPVLADEGDQVVGVVTDRDICMATWSRDSAPSQIRAGETMSRDLVYCMPDDSIQAAESTMRSRRVRRLPVLDASANLLGMLSITDITRAAGQKSTARPGFELSPEQIVDTITMITAAHQPLAQRQEARVQEW